MCPPPAPNSRAPAAGRCCPSEGCCWGREGRQDSPRARGGSSTRRSRDGEGGHTPCSPLLRSPWCSPRVRYLLLPRLPDPRTPPQVTTAHRHRSPSRSTPGVPGLSPPASSSTLPPPRPSRSSPRPVAGNRGGPSPLLSVTTHWGWCFHNTGCLGQCYRVFVVKHEVLVLAFFPPVRLKHPSSCGRCLQRCLSAPAPGVLLRGTKPRHWGLKLKHPEVD